MKTCTVNCKGANAIEKLSIVIPTCGREKSLLLLFDSILQQTKLPKEVIIADDGDEVTIRELVKRQTPRFVSKGIQLRYLRNLREKSVSVVRNLGALQAKEAIILFLDDDVVIDKNYAEEILKTYEEYPNAIGVQGLITNIPMSSKMLIILNKIFFGNYIEPNQCRILPSGNTTYPYPQLKKVVNCQWFTGCNQSYQRSIFDTQVFDEKLKRLSSREDMDFSYKIFKRRPDSLYLNPNAKLRHDYSLASSLPDHLLIYNRTITCFYFFYKHIEQKLSNKLIFIWCNIGRIVINTVKNISTAMKTKNQRRFKIKCLHNIRCLINSYIYSIKHLKEIKVAQLEFFHDLLFKNEPDSRTCVTERQT
jgi:GT2 family glycosyltransferase